MFGSLGLLGSKRDATRGSVDTIVIDWVEEPSEN
jgi:hypothetical protein